MTKDIPREPSVIIGNASVAARGPSSVIHWDVSFEVRDAEIWRPLVEEIEAKVVAAASEEFAKCQPNKIALTIELDRDRGPMLRITGQVDLVYAPEKRVPEHPDCG